MENVGLKGARQIASEQCASAATVSIPGGEIVSPAPVVGEIEAVGAHVAFLTEAAIYFENRDTVGEDRAHWANVYNAENCRKAAASLASLQSQVQSLTLKLEERDKALEPFAKLADIFDHKGGNRPTTGVIAQWADHRVGERELTVEHLRRARSLQSKGDANG